LVELNQTHTDITSGQASDLNDRILSDDVVHISQSGQASISNARVLDDNVSHVSQTYSSTNQQSHQQFDELRILKLIQDSISNNPILKSINEKIDDNNKKLREEFKNTYNANSSFSFKDLVDHEKNLYNLLFGLEKTKNNIKIMQLHLNQGSVPISLYFSNYPQPFLKHDDKFIESYNNLIKKFQIETIGLIIERLNQLQIEKASEIESMKFLLNNHVKDVDSIVNKKMNEVNKDIQKIIKKSNDKAQKCKNFIRYYEVERLSVRTSRSNLSSDSGSSYNSNNTMKSVKSKRSKNKQKNHNDRRRSQSQRTVRISDRTSNSDQDGTKKTVKKDKTNNQGFNCEIYE
jgi:hypothetical protein